MLRYDPCRSFPGSIIGVPFGRWRMHGSKDLDNSYVKLVCGQLGIDPEDL